MNNLKEESYDDELTKEEIDEINRIGILLERYVPDSKYNLHTQTVVIQNFKN